jgi:DNA-binding MarR family transcriptional regulator
VASADVRQADLMTDLHLTQRELDIMSVLWDLGEATVTEVRDRVDPELAYTSISSMIRTLELKGYVSLEQRKLSPAELARMRELLKAPTKKR